MVALRRLFGATRGFTAPLGYSLNPFTWTNTWRLVRLRDHAPANQDRLARKLALWFDARVVGADLSLDKIRSAADFRDQVPLRSYAEHADTFERPLYWALTSGTTSAQKAFPVTRELLKSNADNFKALLLTALSELGDYRPLLGQILFLGSLTPLERGSDGVLRGTGTAIAIRERPALFRLNTFPANELDHLPDWTTKMAQLAAMARDKNVRILAGTPPWLLSFCEEAVRQWGVRNLRQVWPSLRLVLSGGTYLEPYRAALERHIGGSDQVIYRNLYSATEGFFAFQDTSEAALLPCTDRVLFEFIPVSEAKGDNPRRLLLEEIEIGADYELVCSSYAGVLGYRMGDIVRFVSIEPPRFVLTGRLKSRLSLTGEKLDETVLTKAFLRAAHSQNHDFGEFVVCAIQPSDQWKAHHHWFIEVAPTASSTTLADQLDQALRDASPTYERRRSGARPILGNPRITWLPLGSLRAWMEERSQAGGHHKIPRILHQFPQGLAERALNTTITPDAKEEYP